MTFRVNKISKQFDQKWVLRDVSFEVNPGEVLGIFGANRSGKSTLLRILAGHVKSNVETLDFGGNPAFFESEMTETKSPILKIFGKTNSVSNTEAKLATLEKVIADSDGTVILDEPFAGFDPVSRSIIVEKIRSSAKDRNLAVVLATSDFEDIFISCDRVAVIVNGGISQIDTPQEVYDKPLSQSVAAIAGRNNLFAARRLTSSKADMPEFQTIDGSHRLFAQRIERGSLGAINQNVTLAIRPEHISISFGASFPEDNLLKAVIDEIQFLGATTLIHLNCGGLNLQALVLRLVGLNIGDECMVGMPPDRIQIFKD